MLVANNMQVQQQLLLQREIGLIVRNSLIAKIRLQALDTPREDNCFGQGEL